MFVFIFLFIILSIILIMNNQTVIDPRGKICGLINIPMPNDPLIPTYWCHTV